ncbi:hypothetical protein GUITHDRAFT_101526 [Guillardia theta CCMP2712]|uniref:Flavin-containing monooxygenase n=1 Tax=Guillardia theta (strain CCMP2712) TaxID=905079 RepID=L1JWW8_GUITC|nr:hypothetical protein GUITHDRAFT_101526 [Guillardia theta CCMP2712]EKX53081.1 hypothetical protein GUITHDRAFT_101526 [Guillardia theta CCMP2712]|eukprot:XP_005840061.1 hypothetical protein GUITHDRAFT_101526 [Guillardia theta CCMP2712]
MVLFFSTSGSKVKKIGIVGAGVAGLQVARSLKERGFDCVLFDKAPDVGGLWRENYTGFGIQVQRKLFEFPDFPASYGDYASGPEIQEYIKSFAIKHDILSKTRLNTTVEKIARRPDGERGWELTVKTPTGNQEKHTFDYTVICQGMYSTTPNRIHYENEGQFAGKILHSSEYLSPSISEGKKVVVVGSGKSAIDIAMNAGEVGNRSTLLFRNAHWGTPRLIAGLIPVRFVFASRFGQALVSWYKGAWPSQGAAIKIAHQILSPVISGAFRVVEAIFAFQFNHKGKWKPSMDFVKDFYGYAQIHCPTFTNMVSAGKVQTVQGEIQRFTQDGVILKDGSKLEADVVVLGTGFLKKYAFFDAAMVKQLGVEEDGLYLYRHILPSHVPDMAFVGAESASLSNITTFAIQSEWLARLLNGELKQPEPSVMADEINKIKEWKRSWMPFTTSRAGIILAHWIHYHDELLKDMKIPHRRKGTNYLAEVFAPYEPSDYRDVLTTSVKSA